MIEQSGVLHTHVTALFPYCRSITGPGLRQTLRYIADQIPLAIHEVPSGTPVLDWEIPLEWTPRGGTIETIDGRRVIDFQHNNLHLMQYSTPFDAVVPLDELQAHLHSLPDRPHAIPYRTSYYQRDWGFCLPHDTRTSLSEPAYRVRVDTTLAPGSLSYGECFLPGTTSAEVLISAHCCHPSLANDNLSSIAVAIELARILARQPRRFGYRFLFAPGTIGAITWLHFNRDAVQRIAHGLVLTCLGDPAPPSYKQSRRGNAPIDRYVGHLLGNLGHSDRIQRFTPTGYDERQFGSPGFDLPMGCLMRSPGGQFVQYHNSDDNPAFVTPEALAGSLQLLTDLVTLIEQDERLSSVAPYGEPQLGRRGLYDGAEAAHIDRMALLWVLNLSDGRHTLLDIAERAGLPFASIAMAAAVARKAGLLVADAAMGHSRA